MSNSEHTEPVAETAHPEPGEWVPHNLETQWQCCDCKLVHVVRFRLSETGQLEVSMTRDEDETSKVRGGKQLSSLVFTEADIVEMADNLYALLTPLHGAADLWKSSARPIIMGFLERRLLKVPVVVTYSQIDALVTEIFGWPWPPNIQILYANLCDRFDSMKEGQK